MKRILTTFFVCVFICKISAFEARLNITVTPSTATIYYHEQAIGTGSAQITLERADVVEIKVENAGYKAFYKAYKYVHGGKDGYDRGVNNISITLEKDDSYRSVNVNENVVSSNEDINELSVKSDSLNNFFTFTPNQKYNQANAWKIVNKIVNNYFDELESLKSDTAYIKSAWQVKTIGSKKIRTRIIIRTDSANPLTYKIKLQSDYSNDLASNVKDDDKYKQWDRVLKKYKNVFSDFNKGLNK